jgi:hypothetical protein
MMNNKRKGSGLDPEKQKGKLGLDWKDYVAISIAALQTTLLPIVLLLFAIVIISVLLRGLVFR